MVGWFMGWATGLGVGRKFIGWEASLVIGYML